MRDTIELLTQLLIACVDGKPIPAWTEPPLTVPVSHLLLQPQQMIDTLAECDREVQFRRIVVLIHAFGVCAGYQQRADEDAERIRRLELLVELLQQRKGG